MNNKEQLFDFFTALDELDPDNITSGDIHHKTYVGHILSYLTRWTVSTFILLFAIVQIVFLGFLWIPIVTVKNIIDLTQNQTDLLISIVGININTSFLLLSLYFSVACIKISYDSYKEKNK